MIQYLYPALKAARPRQWLKNLSVFGAPALMWGLFDIDTLISAFQAFFIFCIVSSAAYYINDLNDYEKDRNHPVKKNRPIASGALPKNLAMILAIIFMILGLMLSSALLGKYFLAIVMLFIFLQFTYSFYFRNQILFDTLLVATFFVIRVIGGGIATQTSISSWLLLTTIGLSLLLAFGKRQSERTLFESLLKEDGTTKTRATLKNYPVALLNRMLEISTTLCLVSYCIYTFETSPDFNLSFMPSVLREPKLFMLSIPLVMYGVIRYLYIVYEKREGESPDKVLTTDKPLIFTILIWGSFVLFINAFV